MRGIQIDVPGELELPDVVGIDQLQRAVAMLVVGATVGHPLGGIGVGVGEPGRIDGRDGLGRGGRARGGVARAPGPAAHQQGSHKTVDNDGTEARCLQA